MKTLPEDLMQTVLAADAIRRQRVGEPLTEFPRWKRVWLEPGFNLLGILVGQILAALPWPLRWRADQRICQWMGARPSAVPVGFEKACQDVAALAQRLKQQTGQLPATMVFTSHPATTGSFEWLRFELVRQGLMLGNAVVERTQSGPYRAAPECFLAIDPYALDTVPAPVAGLYSGFMHRVYLVWDRMSGTQGALQRWLFLRKTGYPDIFRRVLARLRRGAPIVMVLPGGLPFNSRLLYTGREFVHRLPTRLPDGQVRRWPYTKRLAQKKWMEALMQAVEGALPLLQGELPKSTRTELSRLLTEWGFSETDQAQRLAAFAQEFKLDVPYRERFFRILFRRLVAKGKPFLWCAVAHREQAPHARVSIPWGAFRASNGELRLIRGAEGSPEILADIRQVAIDFSREFVV